MIRHVVWTSTAPRNLFSATLRSRVPRRTEFPGVPGFPVAVSIPILVAIPSLCRPPCQQRGCGKRGGAGRMVGHSEKGPSDSSRPVPALTLLRAAQTARYAAVLGLTTETFTLVAKGRENAYEQIGRYVFEVVVQDSCHLVREVPDRFAISA
jgi:hypothetical protein